MKYVISTPSSTLAVPVEDVKTHLRIDSYSDHDNLIRSYIKASSKTIEQRANLMLTAQTWVLYLDSTEVEENIYFYKWPVTSISSIKYYDSDNAQQTMAASNYTSIITLRPSQIIIDDVPAVYERSDAMEITFVGGYTTLPEDITLAIMQRCDKYYNNPSANIEERTTMFEKVITDYRVYEK